MGSGPNTRESLEEADSSRRNRSVKTKDDANCQADLKTAEQTEAALFRDPYAVLAELAASAPPKASKSSSGVAAGGAPSDIPGNFSDPFTTTPQERENLPESLLPLAQGKDAHGKETQGKDANEHGAADAPKAQETADKDDPRLAPEPPSKVQPEQGPRAERGPEAPRSTAAVKLRSDIVDAINNGAHMPDLPHIEVQATPEGILISLTDDANYSMFAIGSAEPQTATVQIMEKIGQILKAGSSSIVIRGHTDGRPYKSAIYDNWRLSSARAHMALYMLARGGLSEKRIENVEGYADHHLKTPNNPNASENRRIEILLRKENP